MARFMDFLILVTLCFYLANLAIEGGSSASLVVPQSLIQTTAAAEVGRDENSSPATTVKEAENPINLLPATMELSAKGIDKDYYFFNTRMADVRVWKVPGDVSYRNDRDLVITSEIEQSRHHLRDNSVLDFGNAQEPGRSVNLAADFR